MSLSQEQVKHDRINLGRFVKRLENVLSDEAWTEVQKGEEAWMNMQGVAQKIIYARQLLRNVDYYQELDPRTLSPSSQQKYLQNMREKLDRLDSLIDVVQQRLTPGPNTNTSYLAWVSLPITIEGVKSPENQIITSFPEAKLIPSGDAPPDRHPPSPSLSSDPMQNLLHCPPSPLSSSLPPPSPSHNPTSLSLFSASLQTHEELSNELARMATQLKRNAVHFSESLDKDKSLVQTASDALEKNYDTMTKERVRLRDHRGKSFGTTWMVFGALAVVSIAWVFMFFIIRFT